MLEGRLGSEAQAASERQPETGEQSAGQPTACYFILPLPVSWTSRIAAIVQGSTKRFH